MQGAFGFDAENHATAWQWLTFESQADICLLQEVVPDEKFLNHWSDYYFVKKYSEKNWGSMILVRQARLDKFDPTVETPWLRRFQGSAPVALHSDSGLTLCSIHSNAVPVSIDVDELPGTLLRCNEKELWEIELIAHDLAPMLKGKRFIVGGDLNSSLGFNLKYKHKNNSLLFSNLIDYGFNDTRLKFFAQEQQTYFKQGSDPYQIDHVYTDADSFAQLQSWEVLSDLASGRNLSDHAPVIFTLG